MTGALSRIGRNWRALSSEQRLAAIAAFALLLSMLLPWYHETGNALVGKSLQSIDDSKTAFGVYSFVEAAIFVVVVGVLVLLWARAERKAFHLPGGDGTVIMGAGLWVMFLDLLPPARQAQRPPRRADPDLDRRRLGHLHRLPARRAARLRRLPPARGARPRAGGRRRAAARGRDRPRAGRRRPPSEAAEGEEAGAPTPRPPSWPAGGARSPPTTSSTASCPSTSRPSTARPRAAGSAASVPGQLRAPLPVLVGGLGQRRQCLLERARPMSTSSAARLLRRVSTVAAPLRTTSAHGCARTAASASASGVVPRSRAAGGQPAVGVAARGEPAVGQRLLDDHAHARPRAPRASASAGRALEQVPGRLHGVEAADLERALDRRRPGAGRWRVSPMRTPACAQRARAPRARRRRRARRSRASPSGSGRARGARRAARASRRAAGAACATREVLDLVLVGVDPPVGGVGVAPLRADRHVAARRGRGAPSHEARNSSPRP